MMLQWPGMATFEVSVPVYFVSEANIACAQNIKMTIPKKREISGIPEDSGRRRNIPGRRLRSDGRDSEVAIR